MNLNGRVMFGVSVNNVTGITGKRYDLSDLIHAAVEAEAMGFDGIWIHDAPTGRRTSAAHDPATVLAAIAGRTKRIKLATGILIPQIRNPFHMAQQWATLWDASEGRALMGAATGAGKMLIAKRHYQSVAVLQHDQELDWQRLFERRARLFGECMDVMRRLWREDKLSYDGEFYRFRDITLGEARPAEPPPVLIGAGVYIPKGGTGGHHYTWSSKVAGTYMMGPRITRMVADYGEGWLTPHISLDELDQKWTEIQEYARKKYPDRTYVKGYNCFMNVDEDPVKAREGVKAQLCDFHGPPVEEDLVDRWAAAGSGRDIAAKLNSYVDHGVTVFQCVVASPDQLGMMKRIAEEVLPHVKREAA